MMIEGMAAPASPCWPAGRLHRAFFGAGGCLQTWTARAGLRLIHHHQRSKGNAKDTKPRRVVSPARAKAKAVRRVYVQFTISTIRSAPRSLAVLLLDSRESSSPVRTPAWPAPAANSEPAAQRHTGTNKNVLELWPSPFGMMWNRPSRFSSSPASLSGLLGSLSSPLDGTSQSEYSVPSRHLRD